MLLAKTFVNEKEIWKERLQEQTENGFRTDRLQTDVCTLRAAWVRPTQAANG
jgi:hypothetical protein